MENHDWHPLLPAFDATENNQISRITKHTPHELMFGDKMKLPSDRILQQTLKTTNTSTVTKRTHKEALKTLQMILKHKRKFATANQKLAHEKWQNTITVPTNH